ncbi:MAG: uroporphyrinogen-III synthase, partial [Rhodospirillaceae bacterium]
DSRLTDLSQAAATLRHDLDHLAGQVDGRVDRLGSGLAVLEQRLTAMENAFSPASLPLAGGEATPAAMKQRLAALETAVVGRPEQLEALTRQVTALEARLGNLGDRFDAMIREQVGAATLATVYDRLAALEEAVRRTAARQDNALAWLLAVAQLREAVHRGAPFAAELHAARALAEEVEVVDAAVTGFVAYAATGLPTRTTLEARFDSLNSEIARAAMAPEGDGWLEYTLQHLVAVITIRRTDGAATGEGTLAIMARASAALQSGGLAGAVRAMEALQGGPARVANAWIAFARARAAADEALSGLTARALGRTAANHVKAGG